MALSLNFYYDILFIIFSNIAKCKSECKNDYIYVADLIYQNNKQYLSNIRTEQEFIYENQLVDMFEEPKGWLSKFLTFPYPLMHFSSHSLILYKC